MTKSFAVATLSRSTTTTAMTLGLKLADSEEEARASAYADQQPARPEDSWSHKTLAAEIPVASIPEVQARDERIATLEAALWGMIFHAANLEADLARADQWSTGAGRCSTLVRIGEAVGSCLFSWRTPVRICALRVDLGHWEPGSSVSYEHGWFDLDHALDHLPCVPSFYNLYADLKAAIPR